MSPQLCSEPSRQSEFELKRHHVLPQVSPTTPAENPSLSSTSIYKHKPNRSGQVCGSAISELSNYVPARDMKPKFIKFGKITNARPHSHSRKRGKWKQRRTKLQLCWLNCLAYSMSCYWTLSVWLMHTRRLDTHWYRDSSWCCIYTTYCRPFYTLTCK